MPRLPRKNVDDIFESIKDLNFFNDEGHVVKLSNPVWKITEASLNREMTKKYLYLYVSQNRGRILERLRQEYNINNPESSAILLKSTDSADTSCQSNNSNWSMSSPCNLKPWRTTINLEIDTWLELYGNDDSNSVTLKPGWTDIIYREIWKQLKIPCSFCFKFGQVNHTAGEIFFKVKGKHRMWCIF